MAEEIVLDRHVLASPATAYDTAWATYGVTPGARGRAGRLEEEVPWGTHVTRAADPARLSGPVEDVLDPANLDRLGHAVLPVQEWIAFSLWGAFGHGGDGGPGEAGRRVLTHTLLLSADAFRRIGGHPAGLLGTGAEPAGWLRALGESDFDEPVTLDPVRVPVDAASRETLDRARLEELVRLRGVVLPGLGGDPDRLREVLAAVYEALARTRSSRPAANASGHASPGSPRRTPLRHVVVRGEDAPMSALLRLVWLSLPLEDRLEVSFVTEQRRTERPRARLLGLPAAEWGRYVPDGSWVLGEDRVFDAAPGRARWAEVVAAPTFPDAFEPLDATARRRRWRLVGADDLDAEAERSRWRSRWRAAGPTVEGARELWRVERLRPVGPRARAVGGALGRSGAGRPPAGDRETWLSGALALVEELAPEHRAGALRGAVRELRRSGREGRLRAALLRCRSSAAGLAPAGELHRLVDRESDALRTLLADESGAGGVELIRGAAPSASRGDATGRKLVRLGAVETTWTGERAAALAAALADRDTGCDVLVDVLATVLREGHPPGAVGELAGAVLPRLDAGWRRRLARLLVDAREEADPAALGVVLSRLVPLQAAADDPAEADVAADLLGSLATVCPPALEPEPWRRTVSGAEAAWLARPAVLDGLVEALDAGRDRFGAAPSAARDLAGALAVRLLETAGATGLDERAEGILRLLWTAGSDGPLDALRRRPEQYGVLIALLTHPAPIPLHHRIRRRLERLPTRTSTDALVAPPGAFEAAQARLASWAPALAARRRGPARPGRRVLLARGR